MYQHTFGHGDIDVAALAAALRIEQRSEYAQRRHHRAAENVGDLQIGNHRVAARGSDLIDESGIAAVINVMSRHFAVWAGLPVTGDGAIHDPAIDRFAGRITNTQSIDHAGTKTFHHRIGFSRQF